jgi:signal transduction histidine kinase
MVNKKEPEKRPSRPGFRVSLRTKLYAGFLFVAFAGLAVGGVLVDRNVRATARAQVEDRLSYETTMLGQMTANALFGEIDSTDASLNDSVHALGDAVHTQLAVIAKNGTVVADSESLDPLSLPSQLDKPEVVAARVSGTGAAVRDGRMFVAHAIISDGKKLGFARSSVSMDVVSAHVRDVRLRMAYGAVIAGLVAVLLGYVISSRIVRPLRALFAGARRVGAGDFDHPIVVTTRDEIAELSGAFNEMTVSLRETISKLDERNRDVRLMLDNVSQGLLTLDRRAVMSVERSAILDAWFGPADPDTAFWDYVARVDNPASGMFRCAWEALLEGVMPFEVSFAQLPSKLSAGERMYEIEYTPLRDGANGEEISGMLVVISDVTLRVVAERAEGELREIASAFERMMKDKAAFVEFFAEAQVLVEQLRGEARPPLETVKRLLHTLKGNAAMFGLTQLASVCHRLEDQMHDSGADLSSQEREELAHRWEDFARRLHGLLDERAGLKIEIEDEDYDALLHAVVRGAPRYEIARKMADWKLERVDKRLQRVGTQARNLGIRLGKGEIDVDVDAGCLRLSREALAPFWTAFMHVVRNAVDHGLEGPDERSGQGKSASGRLRLLARHLGDEVVVEVTDDGRGIDWETVARHAKDAGLPHANLDDLMAALFHDGLSTRTDVSEVSGRGMGLAAVRAECDRLGGTVSVISQRHQGTTFRFTFRSESLIWMNPRVRDLVRSVAGVRNSIAPLGTV